MIMNHINKGVSVSHERYYLMNSRRIANIDAHFHIKLKLVLFFLHP